MNILAIVMAWKYPALVLLGIFEGPVTMMTVGFLLKLGYFPLIPAFGAVFLGDLIGDFGWYSLGYFGAHRFVKRFGRFFSLDETSIAKIAQLFRRHESYILFLSKITMGFGLAVATIFTAGMSHVPLKKFFLTQFFGGIIWTSFLLSVGYGFGNLYLKVSAGLQIASLVFFGALVIGVFTGVSRYIKSRVLHIPPTV